MTEERAPDRARDAVRDVTRVVLWGLVFYAAVQLAGAWLVKSKLGAVAVQAALAEWGAGRVGVVWTDANAPPPNPLLEKKQRRGSAYRWRSCPKDTWHVVPVVTDFNPLNHGRREAANILFLRCYTCSSSVS